MGPGRVLSGFHMLADSGDPSGCPLLCTPAGTGTERRLRGHNHTSRWLADNSVPRGPALPRLCWGHRILDWRGRRLFAQRLWFSVGSVWLRSAREKEQPLRGVAAVRDHGAGPVRQPAPNTRTDGAAMHTVWDRA